MATTASMTPSGGQRRRSSGPARSSSAVGKKRAAQGGRRRSSARCGEALRLSEPRYDNRAPLHLAHAWRSARRLRHAIRKTRAGASRAFRARPACCPSPRCTTSTCPSPAVTRSRSWTTARFRCSRPFRVRTSLTESPTHRTSDGCSCPTRTGARISSLTALRNVKIGVIALGGEAGNTHYDAVSHCIIVAVQTKNELAAIDPRSMKIVARYPMACDHPHGFLVDEPNRVAFVSCEGDSKLLVVDLRSMRTTETQHVAEGPDVLALDPGLHRLYVASESGSLAVFEERGAALLSLGEYRAPHSHTVAVDPGTHRVYLPLQDVDGKPVLAFWNQRCAEHRVRQSVGSGIGCSASWPRAPTRATRACARPLSRHSSPSLARMTLHRARRSVASGRG